MKTTHLTMDFQPNDEFRVSFAQRLPGRDGWFRAPAAVARSGRSRLALRFAVEDPHLLRALRPLVLERSPSRRRGATLLMQFFGADHTWKDLFGALLKKPRAGSVTMPISARLGVSRDGEIDYSKPLYASVRAQVIAYGGPYLFDCHSEWRAWWNGIYTRCEASRCVECGTFGADGKWYDWGEMFGWRLCFCND